MPKQAPLTLPDGIEIFRAGKRAADDGTVYEITEADVAAAAAAYSPHIHEAPLTVGHPESNRPAYGWVASLQADGGVLKVAAHRQVEAQFAEMVAHGRFKKRSASFYQPNDPSNPKPGAWYLRHVAYLGAQPPAVKGLKDIEFSEGASSAVNFSETATEQEQDDMSKELQAQLDAATAAGAAEKAKREEAEAALAAANQRAAAADAQRAEFAERARTERRAGFVAFAEGQVKAGRLLPKDKDMAVATLEALADAKPVEFSEGNTTRTVSHAQWLQDLIANAKPAVSFGEFAPGQAGQHSQEGSAKGKTDAEIDAAAKDYARTKNVSYAEALTAVVAGFSS